MVQATDPNPILRKRKVLSTLFSYAVYLARGRERGMVDTISRVARASRSTYLEFIWNHIGMYITPLFGKPTPLSPNSVVVSTFHHIPRRGKLVDEDAVTRRLAATSAALYTQEIGWSVVDALLQVVSMHSLRPHIPIGMWVRLVKWPSPP